MAGALLSCGTQRYQQRSPHPCPCALEGTRGTSPLSKNPALRGGSKQREGRRLPLAALGVLAGGASGAWLQDDCADCWASRRASGGSWVSGHLGWLEEAVTMALPREGVPRVPKRPSVTGRASSTWLQISGQSSWRWWHSIHSVSREPVVS